MLDLYKATEVAHPYIGPNSKEDIAETSLFVFDFVNYFDIFLRLGQSKVLNNLLEDHDVNWRHKHHL